MANYQNLHLADKTLFDQFRTLFKTNVSSAQEILDNSQLALKSFRANDHNDLASDIITLENNYYTNVPTRLNSLLTNFNNDVSKIQYRGIYSSSTSYYQYNVVSYAVSGNTNLYMCKLPSGTSVISNIVPTNTTYWLYLGLQGDQGAPTIGNLKYIGNWSSSGSYSVDDVVTYGNDNNVLYALKQSSPGTTPPPSNAKWVEIVVLDRRKINFSDSNLTEGDIYWQELT